MRKRRAVVGLAVLCSISAGVAGGQATRSAGAHQPVCDSLALRTAACAELRPPGIHVEGVFSYNGGTQGCDDGDGGCHPPL